MLNHLLPLIVCLFLRPESLPEEPSASLPGKGDRVQAATEKSIAKSIAKGRENLLVRLRGILKSVPEDYPVGRLAFPAAALLKAGTPTFDPVIQDTFAKLAALKVEKTYCAACYLFAIDGFLKARVREAQKTGSEPAATTTSDPSDELKRKLAELVRWLVDARLDGDGSWSYGAVPRKGQHDFSNTQFAVLGLRIGLEHGVDIPREAFLENLKLFTGAITREEKEEVLEFTLDAPLEVKLKLTRVSPVRKLLSAPGGWGYTDPRRGKGERDDPYPSMTAAGASSVIISLAALSARKVLGREESKTIADAERALHSAYRWIEKRFDLFLSDDKDLYYTLYSLEKVGDLGGVEKFGSHDWYAEGAAKIVERQEPSGSWGTYVNTSLALMFLTRATRLFEAASGPTIVTGKREGGPRDGTSDLVYIARANGFLSAGALLKYMSEVRRPELVVVGEEVVRNYPPDRTEELISSLLQLWQKSDRVTTFAQKVLADLTGIQGGRKEAYEDWQQAFEEVKAFQARKDLPAEELEAAMKRIAPPRLKARLVGIAHEKGLRKTARTLIEHLALPSMDLRRRIHGILLLWTAAPVTPPPKDTEAGWETTAKAWQDWWTLNGADWEARMKG